MLAGAWPVWALGIVLQIPAIVNAGTVRLDVFLSLSNSSGHVYNDQNAGLHQVFAAIAFVAVQHCNERYGGVTQALSDSSQGLGGCPGLTFDSGFYDTQENPARAVTAFLNRSAEMDIVVGATFSKVSSPLSLVTGALRRPEISHFSSAPSLDDRHDGTSLFTRTVPSDLAAASVFGELLSYQSVTQVGMIYVDGPYGVGFRDSVSLVLDKTEIGFHPTSFQGGNLQSITFALQFLRSKNLNVIILIALQEEFPLVIESLVMLGMDTNKLFLTADGFSQSSLKQYFDSNSTYERKVELTESFVQVQVPTPVLWNTPIL
mmetsp:Transcript_10508/g.19666  ORF Transcript_10508/g.19666 Transcript_10508/m.19666 type:complete len:318 (-) Transcript_10508:2642-3595(-)